MGSEALVVMKRGRKSFTGRALLESNELRFRGEENITLPLKSISSAKSVGGWLHLATPHGSLSFQLKEKAEGWEKKILHPKSRLDKLGVKEESSVCVLGVEDEAFLAELHAVLKKGFSLNPRKNSDLIFVAAESKSDLSTIRGLKTRLTKAGGMWIVFRKGKEAVLKDTEVMKAGKDAGLVDTKVAGFSETHTALKFVIPLASRE